VSKNWPNDPIIDCEPPSNLVEVIEKDFWKKKKKEFKCFSEQNELVDI
jgi:hypothetical protein